MKKEDLFKKVESMVKEIAENPDLSIDETTRFEDIESWDSLNTVDLEMELENSFAISFEVGEFLEVEEVGTLIELLQRKIK